MVVLHIILPAALSLALAMAWSIASPARAQAAPRRVAVINAAADQGAGAVLAERLRRALTLHGDLSPVPAGDLARALEAALEPPETSPAALEEVRGAVARAQAAMARFAYDEALVTLAQAEQRLLGLVPSAPVSALLARVAFERGRILLHRGDREGAHQELALARRLDPAWDRLDPSVYVPEVVAAFEAAGAEPIPAATVEVTTMFDGAMVFIDGRRTGRTPVRAHLPPGIHYVTGIFADQHVASERVLLGRETRQVKLRFEGVTLDDRARNWRITLVQDAPLATRSRMQTTEIARNAADLTGADAVLLIADDGAGTLYIAVHDQEASTPSAWRPVLATSIDGILASLAAARRRARLTLVEPLDEPSAAEMPWWRSPWGKTAIGAGIAASVLAIAVRSLIIQDQRVIGSSCCTVSLRPVAP